MVKEAYAKKQRQVKKARFRCVQWNVPTFTYATFWNWLERCWGIECVMDLETYGRLSYIDTSTEESVKGLGKDVAKLLNWNRCPEPFPSEISSAECRPFEEMN